MGMGNNNYSKYFYLWNSHIYTNSTLCWGNNGIDEIKSIFIFQIILQFIDLDSFNCNVYIITSQNINQCKWGLYSNISGESNCCIDNMFWLNVLIYLNLSFFETIPST